MDELALYFCEVAGGTAVLDKTTQILHKRNIMHNTGDGVGGATLGGASGHWGAF